MKIVFNGHLCGYGNNGGSHTIIQSAKHLAQLGAEVTLYGIYKYTWQDKPENVKVVPHGKIPTCDVIVATGQSTVPSTIEHSRCNKKFWWVRGHEIWSTKESQLIRYYKQIPCMANSKWLRDFIKQKTGKNVHLQYQGVDFDLWKEEKPWEEREYLIGGLYSKRHKTKNHWILEELEKKGHSVTMLNRDIRSPTFEQQKNWYNNIKYWVSTSTLEGLHNPPMEAGLCGCCLLTNSHTRNGTSDYDLYSYRYDEEADWDDAVEEISAIVSSGIDEIVKPFKSHLPKHIKNTIGSREENMNKMLEIFKL